MSARSPVGRVAYPNIAKARVRQDKPDQEPRRSVTLVWPHDTDFTDLKKLIRAAAEKKFPGGIPKKIKSPIRPGTDKEKEDGSYPEGFKADDWFAEFWTNESNGPVPCVTAGKTHLEATEVYAGMTGLVYANASGYSNEGNKGVSLHLEAFQKHRDGEPIGSTRADPEKVFENIDDGDGLDEDTPF